MYPPREPEEAVRRHAVEAIQGSDTRKGYKEGIHPPSARYLRAFSILVWQAMQKRASGRAFRRDKPISSPQLSQMP